MTINDAVDIKGWLNSNDTYEITDNKIVEMVEKTMRYKDYEDDSIIEQ